MKKIIFCIIITNLTFAVAQVQLCINKSTTIPYVGANQDTLKDWKVNKFNWMVIPQGKIYLDQSSFNLHPPAIIDPFRGSAAKDFRWPIIGDKDIKNGWELVKQDLGYYNNDNQNLAIKKKGNSTARGDMIPYIILYNKYRGTLRVMGYMLKENKNIVKVSLTFNNVAPNRLFGKAVGNGILRQYEKSGESALDKPTTVVDNVNQFAVNLNYLSNGELFFADFQLSYDPCICQFYSGLEIRFDGVEHATLKAFSKTVDISEASNNPDVLASVINDANGNVQGGIASFKSLNALKTQLVAVAGSNSNYDAETKSFVPNVIKFVDDVKKGIKFYDENYEKLSSGMSVLNLKLKKFEVGETVLKCTKDAGKIFGAIGVVTDIVSLFIGGDEDKAIANPSISAISGTVTQIPGIVGFTLATPGSSTSNDGRTLDFEYASQQADYNADGTRNVANLGWYGKSVRPMYNEILGVYSLLTTPEVSYFNINQIIPNRPSKRLNKIHFKLPNNNENIKYAINPALSVDGYSFRYALEIRLKTTGNEVVYNNFNKLKIAYNYGNGEYVLITPFLKYQELSNFTPAASLSGTNLEIISIKLKVAGIIIFSEKDKSGTNNSLIFSRTFKTNATKVSSKLKEYPQQISSVNYEIISGGRGNAVYGCVNKMSDVPDTLTITDPKIVSRSPQCMSAITNPLTLYAREKIIINTKEVISGQLNFSAPAIIVEGESSFDGEVVMDTQISIFGTVLPNDPLPEDIDNNFYTNYCSISNNILTYKAYQTNIDAGFEKEAPITSLIPKPYTINSPKLQITPNPTTGQVTFYYSLPTDGHVSLCVSVKYL